MKKDLAYSAPLSSAFQPSYQEGALALHILSETPEKVRLKARIQAVETSQQDLGLDQLFSKKEQEDLRPKVESLLSSMEIKQAINIQWELPKAFENLCQSKEGAVLAIIIKAAQDLLSEEKKWSEAQLKNYLLQEFPTRAHQIAASYWGGFFVKNLENILSEHSPYLLLSIPEQSTKLSLQPQASIEHDLLLEHAIDQYRQANIQEYANTALQLQEEVLSEQLISTFPSEGEAYWELQKCGIRHDAYAMSLCDDSTSLLFFLPDQEQEAAFSEELQQVWQQYETNSFQLMATISPFGAIETSLESMLHEYHPHFAHHQSRPEGARCC